MFVISCLSVLVQEGAFGTLLSAAATNSSVSLSLSFWLLLFGSVSYVSIDFRKDSVACSSFRAFLFCCRQVLLLLSCQDVFHFVRLHVRPLGCLCLI